MPDQTGLTRIRQINAGLHHFIRKIAPIWPKLVLISEPSKHDAAATRPDGSSGNQRIAGIPKVSAFGVATTPDRARRDRDIDLDCGNHPASISLIE